MLAYIFPNFQLVCPECGVLLNFSLTTQTVTHPVTANFCTCSTCSQRGKTFKIPMVKLFPTTEQNETPTQKKSKKKS